MLENESNIEQPPPQPAKKRLLKRIDASSIFVGMLVFAAGAGLYYMHWRTAETLAMLKGADADKASVDTFLSGGRASLASLGKSLRETKATVALLTRTPMPVQASSVFDQRDPFAFDSLEPRTQTPVAASSNSGREQMKNRLLTQARTLQVQSIMFGSAKRSCLINGKLYFEGAPCGEFVVESIAPDAVYIQAADFRFELRLRK